MTKATDDFIQQIPLMLDDVFRAAELLGTNYIRSFIDFWGIFEPTQQTFVPSDRTSLLFCRHFDWRRTSPDAVTTSWRLKKGAVYLQTRLLATFYLSQVKFVSICWLFIADWGRKTLCCGMRWSGSGRIWLNLLTWKIKQMPNCSEEVKTPFREFLSRTKADRDSPPGTFTSVSLKRLKRVWRSARGLSLIMSWGTHTHAVFSSDLRQCS